MSAVGAPPSIDALLATHAPAVAALRAALGAELVVVKTGRC
jgi:hypothetical protein